MLNVAYIHMPTKITEKVPLTKSWDEFFNSDNTLAESSLIGQLNTCDHNHETLIMTRIQKVITDKQITEPRKGFFFFFFFFFFGGGGGLQHCLKDLLLTAKPANARPVSTTSLSKLLASLTFMGGTKRYSNFSMHGIHIEQIYTTGPRSQTTWGWQ